MGQNLKYLSLIAQPMGLKDFSVLFQSFCDKILICFACFTFNILYVFQLLNCPASHGLPLSWIISELQYIIIVSFSLFPHTFHSFFMLFFPSWTLTIRRNINFSSRISNSSALCWLCKLLECALNTVNSWLQWLHEFLSSWLWLFV